MSKNYQAVIGLEIHVELTTASKMFCGCSAEHFGIKANTHTCPVCLGLPGALPYPNKEAIDDCIRIALALGCEINTFSYFERKNYFYPDLPKAFQLSQYQHPFGKGGTVSIDTDGDAKKIGITRVHQEEDTGKIIHETIAGKKASLIDFNRSGVPLVEIVTEPDIQTGSEAKVFLTKLRQIIRYLGVSSADMEKGQMRLEPNISLRKPGETTLPKYKVEVKNINSFRFVEKAIDYEIERQAEILDKGALPKQETRGWDEVRQKTVSQRSKEEAHDYRYFPEPDIPPISISEKAVESLKQSVCELPDKKRERFESTYAISSYQSELLTRERETADFFEEVVKLGSTHSLSAKDIANEIINNKIDVENVLPATLVKSVAESKKVDTIDENELDRIVTSVIETHTKVVDDYKSGKENAIMFLVGQVMREVKKKIDVKMVIEKLKRSI